MVGPWENQRSVSFGLFFILIVTFPAYLPTLGNLFSSFQLGNYHPLTLLSYALQYRFFGLDAQACHAVNLAIHLLNTALVFRIVALLGGAATNSFVTALLFGQRRADRQRPRK